MRFRSLALAMALAATTPVFAADDVLQQADTLLRQQQATQAYDLLAPLEDERAGDPAYDYLFGVALLETGDPSRAIFAFERCLAVDPNNGPCRVQMARTHLAIGETDSARAELQTIKEYNPPPAVQSLVSQYLGVIDKVEKRQKRHVSAYAQLGGGYDSNINSAPGDAGKAAAAIPPINTIFGQFLFPASAVNTSEEAGYANIQAGAGIQYKLAPALIGLGDISLLNRSYIDHNDSNYQTADLSVGAAYQYSQSQVIGKLSYQNMWLDSENYRDAVGLLGQYQYSVSDLAQVSAFTQFNQLRYDQISSRDADRFTLGLAYSQALESPLSPVFYASLYGGNENTKDSAADAFSQDFTGLRAGGSLQLVGNIKFNGSLSAEKREFQANFPFYGKAREETQYDLSLGLSWKLSNQLSLLPNYAYSRNNSNISLIESTRHIVGIDLRYDL